MADKKLYCTTFTFDGKRYYVRSYDENDLAVKVAMKKRDLEDGERKKLSKNTTVKLWFETYLEMYRRPSIGDLMYADLKSQYRVWISPAIGKMQLKDVKPIHCQNILNSMSGKSRTHISKVRQLLYQIFEMALENNLVFSNPAKRLKSPKAESGTHRAITDAERQTLLAVCDTNKYGLWAKLMLYCGARPSETGRIQIRHIDLKNKKLYIDGTKTKAARRYVPIPDCFIVDLKSAISGRSPFEYLFVNQSGTPINRTNRQRMWNSLRRDMNILHGCKVFRNEVLPPFWVSPDFTPYCLRHTYCTDLQTYGVPLNVAKEFMGHSDISTTANIYTHNSEQSFSDAADKINCNQINNVALCVAPSSASIENK